MKPDLQVLIRERVNRLSSAANPSVLQKRQHNGRKIPHCAQAVQPGRTKSGVWSCFHPEPDSLRFFCSWAHWEMTFTFPFMAVSCFVWLLCNTNIMSPSLSCWFHWKPWQRRWNATLRGKDIKCTLGSSQVYLHFAEVLTGALKSKTQTVKVQRTPARCPSPVLGSFIHNISTSDRQQFHRTYNHEFM